jgi:predicted transcriptional regulator
MTDFLKQAIQLVQAQATVRVMNEDEIISMTKTLAARLEELSCGEPEDIPTEQDIAPAPEVTMEPKRSIKERSITCLECGKVMKVLTKKHLDQHGLTAITYRAKWGLKKGTALACKELQRTRRAKMKDMRLWERKADKKKIDFGSIEDL